MASPQPPPARRDLRGSLRTGIVTGVVVALGVALLGQVVLPALASAMGLGVPSAAAGSVVAAAVIAAGLGIVAERRAARRARGRSAQALEAQRLELAQQRARFLTSISHELRTPLSNLSLGAATIREHGGVLSPSMSVEVADRITSNAERLERLVLDLLELRGEGVPVQPSVDDVVDVGGLVRDAVERVRAGGRVVDLDVDGEVDALRVDPVLVRRIVDELLANVVRHTPSDVSASVAVWREERMLRLSVHDEGPGIDRHVEQGVLEPFVQGGAVAQMPSPGLGIGLSLAARYAARHGGTLRIATDTSGTRVDVSLPVAVETTT